MACIKTLQGPSLPSPVKFMIVLPKWSISDDTRFIAYGTDNEIGIQMMPLDGNPFKSLSYVGSPTNLLHMTTDVDGEYLFIASENDSSILEWRINRRAVRMSAYYGGEGLDPYYCMLEGGYGGPLYKELRDFFYYFQIMHDGEYVYGNRVVTDKIYLCDVINYFNAVGFFPSLAEGEEICEEIRRRSHKKDSEIHLTFEEIIKLYLNHRPVRGIFERELRKAFENFKVYSCCGHEDAAESVESSFLLQGLIQFGESFSPSELEVIIDALVCKDKTNKSCTFMKSKDRQSREQLPALITYEYFVKELLGIDIDLSKLGTNSAEITIIHSNS